MFAYCGNNPVNLTDPTGEFGLLTGLIIGAAVGVASQYVSGVIGNLIAGKQGTDVFKTENTIADYAGAAVSGMIAATGIGTFGAILANVGISTTTYLVNCGIKNEQVTEEKFAWSVGMGVVSGLIGGSGIDVAGKGAILDVSNLVKSTSNSLKKVAMYAAKIVAVKADIAIGTARTIASIVAPNTLTALKDAY